MSGFEKIKRLDNSAPVVERLNIPWSQQVDEEINENLASLSPMPDNVNSKANTHLRTTPFYSKEKENGLAVDTRHLPKEHSDYDTNSSNPRRSDSSIHKRYNQQHSAWTNRRLPSNIINSEKSFRTDRKNDTNFEKELCTTTTVSSTKKMTWASIASQPAKPAMKIAVSNTSQKKKGLGMPPPPMVPGKLSLEVNMWDPPNETALPVSLPIQLDLSSLNIRMDNSEQSCAPRVEAYHNVPDHLQADEKQNLLSGHNDLQSRKCSPHNNNARAHWSNSTSMKTSRPLNNSYDSIGSQYRQCELPSNSDMNSRPHLHRVAKETLETDNVEPLTESRKLLEELQNKNNYNPEEIDLEVVAKSRFFVIKSYSEDDIHRSIKYEIWCSTDHGNKKLDDAFKERRGKKGSIFLFFSVNGSGHFCGMARMITPVDYDSVSSVWSQDKWKGSFKVKWIYVKDVPNTKLRHIKLINNENKSVTHSRDTQEVPLNQGIEVLRILHSYEHITSIFDDFSHYERKQEEAVSSKRNSFHTYDIGTTKPNNRTFLPNNDIGDICEKRNNSSVASGSRDCNSMRGFNSVDPYSGFKYTYNSHRENNFSNMKHSEKSGGVDGVRFIGQNSSSAPSKADYGKKDLSNLNNKIDNRHINSISTAPDKRYGMGSGVQRHTQKDNEYPRWTRSTQH